MKSSIASLNRKNALNRAAFSLVEVVLAIGIFLITVLALVGLLGPTLQSVDEVEKTDEVSSVVNTVNAFLQSSSKIAPGASKFDAIYNAVGSGNFATMFVFRQFTTATGSDVQLQIGFSSADTEIDSTARLAVSEFDNAAGPIYRVVLTPSSVLPAPAGNETKYRSADRDATTKTYTLNSSLAAYEEGYFAMEVRIYAEAPPTPGGAGFVVSKTLAASAETDPLFTYNTAIVR